MNIKYVKINDSSPAAVSGGSGLSVEDVEYGDLSIEDSSGNVVVCFQSGNVVTRNFDSAKAVTSDNISEYLSGDEPAADSKKPDKYVVLQSDRMTSKNSNWSFGGTAWIFGENGATPPATGQSSWMRNNIVYYSDDRFARFSVTMGADTKLMLPVSYGGILSGEGSSCFGVDFPAKKLIIYRSAPSDESYTSYAASCTDVLTETDIPDEMIGSRRYVVELWKSGTVSRIVLRDTQTGFSVETAHDGWSAGRQNQCYGFWCESGTLPTVSDFVVESRNRPDVVFTGDSITEGVYVPHREKRYAAQFRSDNPDKVVVISARGGQTMNGLMPMFENEWDKVRPKAISILIGANGGNSASNLGQFVENCRKIGAVPYVHRRTCQSSGAAGSDNSSLIPSLGVEGARFDIATALGYAPNGSCSNCDSSVFGDGGLHPNDEGQTRMYRRLRIDCPSMFDI